VTAMVVKFVPMEQGMMGIGTKTRPLEGEDLLMLMDLSMKDNGEIIGVVEKVRFNTRMDQGILENGWTMCSMEKGFTHGPTVIDTKANIMMARNLEKE